MSRLSSVSLRPGQLDHPLEVGADHAVLGRGRRQLLEPRELALGRLAAPPRAARPASIRSRSSLISACCSSALAELVLDRLQLLAQEVLALALVDLGLDLRTGSSMPSWITSSSRARISESRRSRLVDVDLLEQLLLLLGRDPQRAGDQVGERRGVVDVGDRELELLGQVRDLLDDLARRCAGRCGSAPRARRSPRPRRAARLDPRDQVGLLGDVVAEPDPLGRPGRGSAASRRGPSASARRRRRRRRRRGRRARARRPRGPSTRPSPASGCRRGRR